MRKYRVRIHRPILGVPITFLCKYSPKQFELVGHEHDINGNGGVGIEQGQFEVCGVGKYKRVLIRKREKKNETI